MRFACGVDLVLNQRDLVAIRREQGETQVADALLKCQIHCDTQVVDRIRIGNVDGIGRIGNTRRDRRWRCRGLEHADRARELCAIEVVVVGDNDIFPVKRRAVGEIQEGDRRGIFLTGVEIRSGPRKLTIVEVTEDGHHTFIRTEGGVDHGDILIFAVIAAVVAQNACRHTLLAADGRARHVRVGNEVRRREGDIVTARPGVVQDPEVVAEPTGDNHQVIECGAARDVGAGHADGTRHIGHQNGTAEGARAHRTSGTDFIQENIDVAAFRQDRDIFVRVTTSELVHAQRHGNLTGG